MPLKRTTTTPPFWPPQREGEIEILLSPRSPGKSKISKITICRRETAETGVTIKFALELSTLLSAAQLGKEPNFCFRPLPPRHQAPTHHVLISPTPPVTFLRSLSDAQNLSPVKSCILQIPTFQLPHSCASSFLMPKTRIPWHELKKGGSNQVLQETATPAEAN